MPFLFNCVSNSIRFIKIKKCNAIPTALVRVRLSLIRKLLHDWTNLYAYPSNAKLGGSMRLDLPSWSMCDDTNQSASQLHVDMSCGYFAPLYYVHLQCTLHACSGNSVKLTNTWVMSQCAAAWWIWSGHECNSCTCELLILQRSIISELTLWIRSVDGWMWAYIGVNFECWCWFSMIV